MAGFLLYRSGSATTVNIVVASEYFLFMVRYQQNHFIHYYCFTALSLVLYGKIASKNPHRLPFCLLSWACNGFFSSQAHGNEVRLPVCLLSWAWSGLFTSQAHGNEVQLPVCLLSWACNGLFSSQAHGSEVRLPFCLLSWACNGFFTSQAHGNWN